MHCMPVVFSALQASTVQCNAGQYCGVQCSALLASTVACSAVYCRPIVWSAVQFTSGWYCGLQCIVLQAITVLLTARQCKLDIAPGSSARPQTDMAVFRVWSLSGQR